ncbi:MAG: LysE family translocator [Eubacteriales bacterium]|nr:LysE family translocator [Eubacteriales bacterium]
MAAILLSSMALAFSGAVMPGPLLTYTIRKALTSGSKAGFLIILGHALLELLLIVVIFFGFDIILQSDAAQTAIGLIGGALLGYMGADMVINALRDKLKIEMDGENGNQNMVLSGVVISAMNPYFLIWWAIIGLGFLLQAYQSLGILGVATFYVGHIAIDFLWYGAISIIIGKTRRFISQGLYRIIVGTLGAVLIYFGITFFVNAVKAIL